MSAPIPKTRAETPTPARSLRTRLERLTRSPAAWTILVAFELRLSWVLLVPSRPVGDFALYREAAAYLLDQGQLDPEFIYMPGYVFLLAAVQALGGGLLAAKMIGVFAGTVVVGAVGGIATSLFGRRAGIVAGAVAAAWPAGIAVASVTGTDMPAAALVALGIFALVRLAPRHPRMAAALCGGIFGLGAFVRAVAAPLAVLSLLYWVATGTKWKPALARTAIAVAIAFAVLLPWGLRNHGVYGQVFLTDSHGGATALVGANPNSEGTFSRSLNLMFWKATGYRVLEETPRHRASDRSAYALAKRWTAFEPAYAVGLVIAKADRLLTHERNLLYWPVFRQGVLTADQREFFDRHRLALEVVTDGFWWVIAALVAAGVAMSAWRQDWRALALLGFPAALTAIYTVFFSEVRYHLAIVPLLFPYAACAVDWLIAARERRFRGDGRPLTILIVAVVLTFAAWSGLLALGTRLRDGHRWAVTLCAYPDSPAPRLCEWRRAAPSGGPSPLRGVWNGVGLRVGGPAANQTTEVVAAARTVIPAVAGRYRVRADVAVVGGALPEGALSIALRTDDRVMARVLSPALATVGRQGVPTVAAAIASRDITTVITGIVEHNNSKPMALQFDIERGGIGSIVDGVTVWISNLTVERF